MDRCAPSAPTAVERLLDTLLRVLGANHDAPVEDELLKHFPFASTEARQPATTCSGLGGPTTAHGAL